MSPHHLLSRFLSRVAQVPQIPLPQLFKESATELNMLWGESVDFSDEALALFRSGMRLAQLAEQETGHAYHNRVHTGEAMLASVALWGAEQQAGAESTLETGLVVLVAMTAHDLHHPGLWVSKATPQALGAIERHCAAMTSLVLRAEGVEEETIQTIVHIIESTEPVLGVPAAKAAFQAHPSDATLWPVLAGEADLLASVWHSTGPERGRRLAAERKAAHQDNGPVSIGSWRGRWAFLSQDIWLSTASHLLQLRQWQDMERDILAEHATAWDALHFDQARTEQQHHMARINYAPIHSDEDE
jgi:hypothetical protein